MTAQLTVSPPVAEQALSVIGRQRGSTNDAVAYIANLQNLTNVSPAVRAENTAGKSPDGAVSISNHGQGAIARFSNASQVLASLDASGTLKLTPNSQAGAARIVGHKNDGPVASIRNAGSGSLALFGSAFDPRLTIESDGTRRSSKMPLSTVT
jgi:hypothetical protein